MSGAPVLVVVSGLSGAGKITVARPLAAGLGAAYLSVDSIEAALARDVLRGGPGVVAECVTPIPLAQMAWRWLRRRRTRGLSMWRFAVRTRRSIGGETRCGRALPDWPTVLARVCAPPPAAFRLDTATMTPGEAAVAIATRLSVLTETGAV
ncbi:hypothetical protein [Roseivivax sediminis]|uniref:AAA domain-containing protein n=1 Tax=Roseivivax sediminis TaxID=936889 RepID=A0A1I1VFD9_9RHOB|nr:hypothetical protein [Roseivivax sediminis]SFD81589.1 hypothetical protein SAMN04515678_103165 [Roseivivax sediminis]